MSITTPLLSQDEKDFDEDFDYPENEIEEVEHIRVEKKISDVKEAKLYAILTATRGTIQMSYVFLNTALLTLAEEEAGCYEDDDECNKKVYGFLPSSFLAIVATTAGVLSCLFLPIMGAIVDFTPYRRLVGTCSAISLVLLQAIFIGTTESTWLFMAFLKAITDFVYHVQELATFSYLPEMATTVDDQTMAQFSSIFSMLQFLLVLIFLVLVIAISLGYHLDDVAVNNISQSICTVLISCGFTAWFFMPAVDQLHKLPHNHKSLITAGFYQNWKTFKGLSDHYSDGLRLFLISFMFGNSGTDSLSFIAVIYLHDAMNMSSKELGIVFFLTVLFMIPGAKIGSMVSNSFNPLMSLKIQHIIFILCTVAACLVLNAPDKKNLSYIFGAVWGLCMGWFYPTTNLIFSLSLPKGQESELTGFYILFSQIINWLPPLLFILLNEAGLNMRWSFMSLTIFYDISFCFLTCMAPWDEIRSSAMEKSKMIVVFDED